MPVLHGKAGEFHESIYGQVRQIFYQEMIYPPLQKRRLPQAATMRSAKKKCSGEQAQGSDLVRLVFDTLHNHIRPGIR